MHTHKTLKEVMAELPEMNKLLPGYGPGVSTVLNSCMHHLVELQERRAQICARCRHYDGRCCLNTQGLLNVKAWDYCSRWAPKPMHEMKEV